MATKRYDATVIGAGPNGLAAAITLAQAGYRVKIVEGRERIGGGCRTKELTLPGFLHDVCSAIHPLGMSSSFFSALPLSQYGLRWIHPTYPVVHPLDGGRAIVVHRSVEETAAGLGSDAENYSRTMGWLVCNHRAILNDFLGPLRFPSDPATYVRFGLWALQPATIFINSHFRTTEGRALLSGMAAHSIMPLTTPGTAAFGMMIGMLAHAVGWPLAAGGSQNLVNAMGMIFQELGGEIETGRYIEDIDEVGEQSQVVLMDTTPRQVLQLASEHLPDAYQLQLASYRYGPGVFKVDFALDGPVPWQAEACRHAGTVHVAGTMDEVVASEQAVAEGRVSDHPYVLVGQLSQFDPTRAPAGKHTLWTYCHAPNGSSEDISDRIESQIERFAPGFRNRINARSTMNAMEMQAYNPNYIGGDINAGVQDLTQLFTRPVARLDPYSTPASNLFICSSSTPPGGGVHGMCGYFAARSAERRLVEIRNKN